jgi:hypothetical protein
VYHVLHFLFPFFIILESFFAFFAHENTYDECHNFRINPTLVTLSDVKLGAHTSSTGRKRAKPFIIIRQKLIIVDISGGDFDIKKLQVTRVISSAIGQPFVRSYTQFLPGNRGWNRCWATAHRTCCTGPRNKNFPPTPCFVYRVDAKPPVFIDGTPVPSYLYRLVHAVQSTEVQSPCSVKQVLRLRSKIIAGFFCRLHWYFCRLQLYYAASMVLPYHAASIGSYRLHWFIPPPLVYEGVTILLPCRAGLIGSNLDCIYIYIFIESP